MTEYRRAPSKVNRFLVPAPPEPPPSVSVPPVSPPPFPVPGWNSADHIARLHCIGNEPYPMERYWLEQAPPLVILLRGAPGSGKSTWAAHYKAKWASEAWVISATDYFRDHAGIVQFRSPWLSQSHLWCRNALYWLCQLRIPRIVIDNTHVHLWEYKEAAFIARAHHYRVFQHVCTGTWQNVNNVPDQLVRKMRAEFEHDADVPHYDEEKS